jgi:hypothetical protein
MKKTIATVLGVSGFVASVYSQGQLIVDSSANAGNNSTPFATTGGLVWLDPDGNLSDATLDTGVDINLELLWGVTPSTVIQALNLDPTSLNNPANTSWLAGQPTGAGDITIGANGTIVDPNGYTYIVPGEPAGTTVYLQLLAWTGNSTTYAGAANRGATSVFSTVLFSGVSPGSGDTSGMSALVIQPVPEPRACALIALSAAAFASFRRKK